MTVRSSSARPQAGPPACPDRRVVAWVRFCWGEGGIAGCLLRPPGALPGVPAGGSPRGPQRSHPSRLPPLPLNTAPQPDRSHNDPAWW